MTDSDRHADRSKLSIKWGTRGTWGRFGITLARAAPQFAMYYLLWIEWSILWGAVT